MRWGIGALATAIVLMSGACPALAEHMRLVAPTADEPAPRMTPERTTTVDLGVTFGRDSFRLGAQVFSALGVYGAWLNGQTRPDGFSLDGRFQNLDRSYDFKLNAEIDAWGRRALEPFVAP